MSWLAFVFIWTTASILLGMFLGRVITLRDRRG